MIWFHLQYDLTCKGRTLLEYDLISTGRTLLEYDLTSKVEH